MEKEKLALLGGDRLVVKQFQPYNTIGNAEFSIAQEVLETGCLSGFVGSNGPNFRGGQYVQTLEKECQDFFEVKHAISVNSWTSGLIAIIGSLQLEPGDEIIVSPWTMCATATAILHWNCIPVFADIDKNTFLLDPSCVRQSITSRTKAILTIDIFGKPSEYTALQEIADEFGLLLIADSAQAPAALYDGRYAGTLGDIGGISLNCHKHIQCGEGGIILTNNDDLAHRCHLIRNHAEAVVDINEEDPKTLSNMLGFNFRLGEIEAGIASEQLKKLTSLVSSRQNVANYLYKFLQNLEGLNIYYEESTAVNSHSYYVLPMALDVDMLDISRDLIVQALRAEGLDCLLEGYQCLHLLPLYRRKIAYGSLGFPWTLNSDNYHAYYGEGLCPVAERYHKTTFIGLLVCKYWYSQSELDLIIRCFEKVWANLNTLRKVK